MKPGCPAKTIYENDIEFNAKRLIGLINDPHS